jgi:thymidylate synthase ThyX
MKITQVSLCPSEAATKAGRPVLTPELLAASGARYSRNNEGLEAILSKIDPANLEKSVDGIFKMVDYGHQSIADMVPVAMFIDGVSIWMAYYIWTLCPTAGGQESSTRYIKIEGLIPPGHLGIPEQAAAEWQECMQKYFTAYQEALKIWEELSHINPALMGIPKSLLEDASEKSQKKVARMRRNYAFDRARNFLPVSAETNMMMIMSARGWVNLCQFLLSHPLPEPRQVGELIRQELELTAPRMLRHARSTPDHQQTHAQEFQKLINLAKADAPFWKGNLARQSAVPSLSVLPLENISTAELADDFLAHSNRYSPIGSGLQRLAVRFSWSSMGFAEIRDLNRHRTGSKYSPQVPRGFYFAKDQIPDMPAEHKNRLLELSQIGWGATARAAQLLQAGDPSYIYWVVLGTEFPFEHTTTADKFIYETELRTGMGAHFRYAKHMRDMLGLWYQKFPETKGRLLEGSAEPE